MENNREEVEISAEWKNNIRSVHEELLEKTILISSTLLLYPNPTHHLVYYSYKKQWQLVNPDFKQYHVEKREEGFDFKKDYEENCTIA